MTEFQQKCVAVIRKHGDGRGGVAVTEIAGRLRTSCLAVSSAMRSLERQKMAGNYRFPKDSQWAAQIWYLTARSG